MLITLAQIDTTVGDISGNLARMRAALDTVSGQASADGKTDLVVFPELCVVGYPPQDLLDRPAFATAAETALERFAADLPEDHPPLLVGSIARCDYARGRALWNAGILIRDRRVESVHPKTLLPTYDVFDEDRWFEPLRGEPVCIRIGDHTVGVTVCEDIWRDPVHSEERRYPIDPVARVVAAGADVVVNLSASPFSTGKTHTRLTLLTNAARNHAVPIVYVNAVGANDSLIFDGRSAVVDADGQPIAFAPAFEEAILTVDLASPPSRTAPPERHDEADVADALVLGIRDYFAKVGVRQAVVGLSGGIDSALTCALAVQALGAENVVGIGMPSEFSSEHSLADAQALADNLGIAYHVVPIATLHDTMRDVLAEPLSGPPTGVTDENLQARLRGMILMAFSNQNGHLVLSTGNKSELAVGYCTLYGDMAGGLAVISDVPKTMVYRVCEHLNAAAGRELIPRSTIDKPPSAELRPDQRDDQSLPPYEVLDPILERYIRDHAPAATIIDEGYDAETVHRILTLVDRAEYKRRQMPLGLRVTSKAFGTGRRLPIAQRWSHR